MLRRLNLQFRSRLYPVKTWRSEHICVFALGLTPVFPPQQLLFKSNENTPPFSVSQCILHVPLLYLSEQHKLGELPRQHKAHVGDAQSNQSCPARAACSGGKKRQRKQK